MNFFITIKNVKFYLEAWLILTILIRRYFKEDSHNVFVHRCGNQAAIMELDDALKYSL